MGSFTRCAGDLMNCQTLHLIQYRRFQCRETNNVRELFPIYILIKRSLYAKATRDKSWAVRLSRIRRLPRLHTQPPAYAHGYGLAGAKTKRAGLIHYT